MLDYMTLHALHQLHVLYYAFTLTLHINLHGNYILDVILRGIHPNYMKKSAPLISGNGGTVFFYGITM